MRAITLLLVLLCVRFACAESIQQTGPLATAGIIPLSIQNEVDVAIENGRQYLRTQQRKDGFWMLEGGRASSLPAFAFLDPAATYVPPCETLKRTCEAALERLAACAPFPQPKEHLRSLAEDALILAATRALYGEEALPIAASHLHALQAIRSRLTFAQWDQDPTSTAWLCQLALDLLPGSSKNPADWEPLYAQLALDPNPTPRQVAIAGYARLRRRAGADSPAAIRAHLRWLLHHPSPMPEDAYFLAAFLSLAPTPSIQEAGFSNAWRTRIAQILISSARATREGTQWGTDADPIRQTLFAVATLVTL